MGACTVEALLVAIRAKCMDCSGNSKKEVERCLLKDCPLYPFRSTKAVNGKQDRPAEIRGQMDIFKILAAQEKGE